MYQDKKIHIRESTFCPSYVFVSSICNILIIIKKKKKKLQAVKICFSYIWVHSLFIFLTHISGNISQWLFGLVYFLFTLMEQKCSPLDNLFSLFSYPFCFKQGLNRLSTIATFSLFCSHFTQVTVEFVCLPLV